MALTEPQHIVNTPPSQDGIDYDAWIYPDARGAMQTVTEHNDLHAIKAEYLHVEDDGSLTQINQSEEFPNGYSPKNAEIIKQHSEGQYITISGMPEGTEAAMKNSQTIPQIVDFASKIDFSVELDWEDFGSWTPEYYQQYKTFVTELRQQLHEQPGAQISIDLEAQTVTAPDGAVHRFEIDASHRERLLKGLDDVGLVMQNIKAIEAFEQRYHREMPWLA